MTLTTDILPDIHATAWESLKVTINECNQFVEQNPTMPPHTMREVRARINRAWDTYHVRTGQTR